MCWVFSVAASDGAPENVENRLEVRLDETCMCNRSAQAHMERLMQTVQIWMSRMLTVCNGNAQVRLTLGAIIGREDSMLLRPMFSEFCKGQ